MDIDEVTKECLLLQSKTPHEIWTAQLQTKLCNDVDPLPLDLPITEDKLRFVCMSDTHCRRGLGDIHIPDGDVFLHTGDFTNTGSPQEVLQFNTFLENLPHRRKIVIPGNHELTFDPVYLQPEKSYFLQTFHELDQRMVVEFMRDRSIEHMKELLTSANVIYLEDSGIDICGLNIYGCSWSSDFANYGFYKERGQQTLDKVNMIPTNTDILLTHGPPLGYNDTRFDGTKVGCVELLYTVQNRVKPIHHIYGHIHEAYGKKTDGVTTYINAATCTIKGKPTQLPVIFDMPLPSGRDKTELFTDVTTA